MLGRFLNQRKHDQAKKLVRNARLHDVLNALDEEDSEKGDDGKRKRQGDNALGHGEFWLGQIVVAVKISVLIGFKNLVENGVLGARVVPNEAATCQRPTPRWAAFVTYMKKATMSSMEVT